MADNLVSESQVSDIGNDKKTKILYGPYGSHHDYKQKYNTLKLLSVAIICLLTGLFIGGYLQKLFNSYLATPTTTTASGINGNEADFNMIAGNKRRKKSKRAPRRNEAECAQRRCCRIITGLTENDLPDGLKCKTLNDEECGEYDSFCDWDCNPPTNGPRGRKRKHFRGISSFNGQLQEAQGSGDNNSGLESYSKCLDDGKLIEVDDCGIEYDVELDRDELESFCKLRKRKNASFKNGGIEAGDQNEENTPPDNGDNSDNIRRLGVLGDDGRVPVTFTSYPYRTVLLLRFNKPDIDEEKYQCTATMISPRWAITAAHCVYGGGDWYSNLTLYKNVRSCNDVNSQNLFSIDQYLIWSEYENYENTNNDIALLRLTVDPGLGYLDFGYNADFSGTQRFNIIQYPTDKPECTKWMQACSYNGWSTYRMTTDECDTYDGSSGSSLYRYFYLTKDRIIFGIHSSFCSSETCNIATRITSGKYNTICNYVEQNDPNHCDDQHNTDPFA